MILLPTDCQKHEKSFRSVLLKTASHHIPSGRHRLHDKPVLRDIEDVMGQPKVLRKLNPTSPENARLNKEITDAICKHRHKNGEHNHMETLDRKTDLWGTLRAIEGNTGQQAEKTGLSPLLVNRPLHPRNLPTSSINSSTHLGWVETILNSEVHST